MYRPYLIDNHNGKFIMNTCSAMDALDFQKFYSVSINEYHCSVSILNIIVQMYELPADIKIQILQEVPALPSIMKLFSFSTSTSSTSAGFCLEIYTPPAPPMMIGISRRKNIPSIMVHFTTRMK